MKALITISNSSGITGRCDEKCYNALYTKCTCCCGGLNHGVGLRMARANTHALTEEKIRENCQLAGIDVGEISIPSEIKQTDLF